MDLEEYKTQLWRCTRFKCGLCRDQCPMWDLKGFRSYTASGRHLMILEETKGSLVYDNELVERIYSCTGCGYCESVCNSLNGVETTKICEAFRADLVRKRLIIPQHEKNIDNIKFYGNPYGEPAIKRGLWLGDQKFDKGSVLLFPGCTPAYRKNEVASATTSILKKIGVEFSIFPSEEKCCGSYAIRTGHLEVFKKLAKDNVNLFRRKGIKTVVTPCPGCYRTLTMDYPKYIKDFEIEIVHLSQLLVRILKEKNIKLKIDDPIRVTYHDPCHLGRHTKIYEPPREILKMMENVELIEMERNRELSRCCGAGGGYLAAYPDDALNIALNRIKEAKTTGANLIITACPFCEINLKRAINNSVKNMDVLDISEFVLKALKTR